MTARVDQLCDLAKAVVEAAAAASPLANGGDPVTVTVTCDDDPDVDADALPANQLHVMIWYDGYTDGVPTTRGEDATDYRLCFLVVERCPDAGRVPTDWRRERTAWVDQCVVKALGNARNDLDGAYALTLDDLTFDQEELIERKLFWTRVQVTLHDEQEV